MFENLKIIYKEHENKSFFYIPDLGIISSGNNIEEARKNLQTEYEKYKAKLDEADIENVQESSQDSSGTFSLQSNYLNEFIIFAGKYFIVIATIAIIMLVISSKINEEVSNLKADLSIDELITKIESIPNKIVSSIEDIQVGESPLKKIEKEIERAAREENKIPPEKKEKIINNINTIVDRNKPFVDAIGRLFE